MARPLLGLAISALPGGNPAPAAAEQAATKAKSEQVVVLEERSGEGEQCLVCRQAVHDKPVVRVRFKGRSFHVSADMLNDFRADPERYFRTLEAHSGLFDEVAIAGLEQRGGYAWFYFGLYVLVGLLSASASSALAVGRARPAWRWFFAGLFFNVVAVALVLIAPRGDASKLPAGVPDGLRKVPTTRAPVSCPSCASAVHPAAVRCGACGSTLAPRVTSESQAARG